MQINIQAFASYLRQNEREAEGISRNRRQNAESLLAFAQRTPVFMSMILVNERRLKVN